MQTMPPCVADTVCNHLLLQLASAPTRVVVHSAFTHACNCADADRLITILSADRALQPYSVRLSGALPDVSWLCPSHALVLTTQGCALPDGREVISFAQAQSASLSITASPCASFPLAEALAPLRELLTLNSDACLTSLALAPADDPTQTPEARIMRPRLEALREAVRGMDVAGAVGAASACAGCGPGLTPASDDLLCGYLGVWYRSGRLPLSMLAAMTNAAAAKTTDISANILRRLGEGLAGESVISLLDALFEASEVSIFTRLHTVAAIGATSGTDLLTGICLGIIDI